MAKERDKDPKQKFQESVLGKLSPKALAALNRESEPICYDDNLSLELSPAAKSALQNAEPIQLPKEADNKFGCVLCESGEYPSLFTFPTMTALTNFISSKEGEDVAIVPFIGSIILLTKGPNRFLLLPGNQQAVVVPKLPVKRVVVIDANLVETELQEDWFLGPLELTRTYEDPQLEEEDDDDDDEDDSDDEEPIET